MKDLQSTVSTVKTDISTAEKALKELRGEAKANEETVNHIRASIKSLLSLEKLVYDCKNQKLKEAISKFPADREFGASSFAVGPVQFVNHLDLGDGDFYVGETANGKPHGRGVKVLLSLNPPAIREAWYKEGQATGRGRFISESGHSYEGELLNDKLDGEGKYTFSSGSTYIGGFKNG